MRLLEVALLAILCVVLAEERCPRGCGCGEGPETEAECGGVALKGKRGEYVNVLCQDGHNVSCALISWYSPRQLALNSCPPLDPQCPPVESLTLTSPRDVEEQLRGVRDGLRKLSVRGSRQNLDPVSIPPSLFTLNLTDLSFNQMLTSLPPLTPPHSPLHSLELSNAGLSTLPDGFLKALPQLQALRLWRNQFTEIPGQVFTDAPSLTNLSLSSNKLSSAECPRSDSQLRFVSLFDNPIRRVGPFSGCQKLVKIDIFDTRQNTTISDLAFANLTFLTSVTLRNANLQSLPDNMFLNAISLQELYLNNNKLKGIPKNLLKDCKSLRKVDLSVNLIEILDEGVFKGLLNLEDVNLNNNQLKMLPDTLLSSSSSLVRFSASHNMLSTLSTRLFQHNTKLKVLDLRYNQLREEVGGVPGYYNFETASPFNSLMNLERLLLSHNQYSSLYHDYGQILLRLKELRMDHNNITELDSYTGELSFLQDDVTVDLTHNLLQTILLHPYNFMEKRPVSSKILIQDNPFHCDCKLYTLLASRKGIVSTDINPNFDFGVATCESPKNYQGILLRNINLIDLTCKLPLGDCTDNCDCVERPHNHSLEFTCIDSPKNYSETGGYNVKLRINKTITLIDKLIPEVSKVDLSGLNLDFVPRGNYTHVKELNLSNNNLHYIPTELFNNNISLLLAGNPISCKCGDAEFVNMIQANSRKIADYAVVSCGDGKGAISAQDPEGLCDAEKAIIGGAIIAVLAIITACAIVVLYVCRHNVKVLLFTKGWCLCLVNEEDLDKDKIFDGFISYSNDDAKFVLTHLLPGLESGPKPFKICVHERDWIAGEWIPAQIIRSVEQSKRTIIVLSNNFLKSVWSQLEFRAAYLNSQKEHRSRVIVILLEDINVNLNIDPELKAYLATNTYLKPTDPYFWEKLRYALPHRKEEKKIRSDGKKLMKKVLQPNQAMLGGLHTKLTPEGLIINAAKDSKDGKEVIPPAILPNCQSLTDLKDPAIMAANCQNIVANVNERQKF